ncbi:signal peptidase II [Marinicaulis flavus]|uniref:Lipoprotein signal peptidase n=2 Tax=Hyphococcus luteus TaxID=2058213 RepID=A0A2S7K8M4_9PROT|nr:signal peptidase II [Marinicaulis flavus]
MKNWWSEARANKLFWYGLAGAALVIALDQATKFWILHGVNLPDLGKIEISGIFDLTYVENRGASFGMLHGARWPLAIIAIGVSLGLGWWLGRIRRPFAAVAVAFIIGGALGNLYDRLAYGYVVDFLDFSGLYFPWVFNVADAAINVGIAFLLYDAWRSGREEKQTG